MAEKAHYLEHRKRVKAKYRAQGIAAWADYEILELALFYAVPRKDTKLIAKDLLARFKSFPGVLEASAEELLSVPGVGPHAALFLGLLKDVSAHYLKKRVAGKETISAPEIVVNYLKATLQGSRNEQFHALFLDTGNRCCGMETLQTGTVNRSAVYPRQVAEKALSYGACGVILAHNHPGGTLKPSNDDLRATEAVRQALSAIEVTLHDHIIISDTGYFSWKEQGLL